MTEQIYKVQDPSGKVREIAGPAGATDAEILEQAQKLFAPNRYAEAAKGAFNFGGPAMVPPAMLWEGLKHANEKIDQGAHAAGGYATDKAMGMGASPETAAGIGTAVNTGIQAVPMVAGGEIAKAAAPVFQGAGRTLQRWAMKPDPKMGARRAGEAVEASLQEGASVSAGGVERLQQRVRQLSQEADDILRANAQIPSGGVPVSDAADAATRLAQGLRAGSNNARDVRAVERARDEFLRHPSAQQSGIPLMDAQAMKQANYRKLGDRAYEEGRLPMAERDAITEITRYLRRGIEREAPEVAPINARLRSIIDALKSMSPQAARNANQPMSTLSPLIASHNPAMGAAYEMSRSAPLRSALARMLYSGSEQIPANVARAAIGSQTIDAE